MRTGRPSISRGHQLGEHAPSFAPRLSLVPREEAEPAEAPVRVAKRSTPPASAPAALPPACDAAPEMPAAIPASPEYHLVHDRLTAIERLARLRDLGALSPEEFAAEKAIVLALPADELVLHASAEATRQAPAPRAQGPSLLGRLLGWKLVATGLAAGLLFSVATQPQETRRFLEETLRLIGA